jgi:ribosomal-protein-alanine N-acetyltransferase
MFLRANDTMFERGKGYWEDKNYWMIKANSEFVCFILIGGDNGKEDSWTIWSDDSGSVWFEDFLLDDKTKEIAHANLDFCGNCGSCSGGTSKKIFGKPFENVCRTVFKFDNPSDEAVECAKMLVEVRINECTNKPITTDRCILSPLAEADFNDLTSLLTNTNVRRYLGGVRPIEDSLRNLRESMVAANNYPFVVRLCGTTELLGLVTIAPHHEPTDMEISYMFLPEHWGKGYAREAIKAILDFCKQKLNLNRVVSETQTANIRSCLLLETLGYRAESQIERFGAKQTIYVYHFENGESL